MKIKLKPIDKQVLVITGATSGIGLTTARLAARKGARLMLVSRNETALQQLTKELTATGTDAAYSVANVGDETQMQAAADAAIAHFGGFDTWINNAGASAYGRLEDMPLKDQRRIFETNFWGIVYGSLIAVRHLKQRGGALINLGSEVSEVAVPLQGAYSASKHAVKGYTDALRIELMSENAPVSVTLIKPSGIDTMYVEHARNGLDFEPKLPAPVYAPDIVARSILHAAATPEREIYVGGGGRITAALGRLAPSLYNKAMSKLGTAIQKTNNALVETDGLHESASSLRERSGKNGRVFESSVYTEMVTHKRAATVLLGGAAALLLGSLARKYVREVGQASEGRQR